MNRDLRNQLIDFAVGAFIGLLVLVALCSMFGCAHCKPIIQHEEVVVKVPVPVEAPPLPVPEPVTCAPVQSENWRDYALATKECFDALIKKIEEYHHIIVSYNETR